jgi:hypothetical protein
MYYARKLTPERFTLADRKDRQSARVHATKLLALLQHTGLGLLTQSVAFPLDRTLEAFLTELDTLASRPRNDDTYFERLFVTELSATLIPNIGRAKPSTVADLAAFIGYNPNPKNLTLAARTKRTSRTGSYL